MFTLSRLSPVLARACKVGTVPKGLVGGKLKLVAERGLVMPGAKLRKKVVANQLATAMCEKGEYQLGCPLQTDIRTWEAEHLLANGGHENWLLGR